MAWFVGVDGLVPVLGDGGIDKMSSASREFAKKIIRETRFCIIAGAEWVMVWSGKEAYDLTCRGIYDKFCFYAQADRKNEQVEGKWAKTEGAQWR